MGKPSVATLMQEFMKQQMDFNAGVKATLAELTSTSKPAANVTSKAAPKAKKTGKRKARKAQKRDLDVAQYQSQKFPVSSDKCTRKVKAWADAGNIARLREYGGVGPRTSGEGEPRVAVVEGNRLLALGVIAACFTKNGKPNKADNAATSK